MFAGWRSPHPVLDNPNPQIWDSTPARSCPSPCIKVCETDNASRLCRGCRRYLEDIAGWSQYSAKKSVHRVKSSACTEKTALVLPPAERAISFS